MNIKEIKKWIAESIKLGGNDFIKWDDIKNKVSDNVLYLMTQIIALYNESVIFHTDTIKEIKFTYKLIEDQL